MINTKSKLAYLIVATNLIGIPAYADTLSFNYQFGDGTTVNGELTGIAISPSSFAATGVSELSIDGIAIAPSIFYIGSYGWSMTNNYMQQTNPDHVWPDPAININHDGSNMDMSIWSSDHQNHIALGSATGVNYGESYSMASQGSCSNPGSFSTGIGDGYCENKSNNTYRKFYDSHYGSTFESSRWSAQITNSPDPVPEPETYAMMLAGLGAVGAMARRRQKRPERTCNAIT